MNNVSFSEAHCLFLVYAILITTLFACQCSWADTIVAYRGADGTLKKKIIPDWPKEVEAEGSGENEDFALKDAWIKAVQQATGLTVDANQEVLNDSVVTDRISTTSKGRVVSYKILDRRSANGLQYIKIRAKVAKVALKKDAPVAKEITMTCPDCNGGRYVKFDITCTKCRGEGVMQVIWKRGVGGRLYKTGGGECVQCRGVGKIQRTRSCERCHGKGKVPRYTVSKGGETVPTDEPENGFGGNQRAVPMRLSE